MEKTSHLLYGALSLFIFSAGPSRPARKITESQTDVCHIRCPLILIKQLQQVRPLPSVASPSLLQVCSHTKAFSQSRFSRHSLPGSKKTARGLHRQLGGHWRRVISADQAAALTNQLSGGYRRGFSQAHGNITASHIL